MAKITEHNGTDQITQHALDQFTGTEQYFKHWLCKSFVYTDGVQFIGANGGYWIIDLIASYQTSEVQPDKLNFPKRIRDLDFQLWKITPTDQGGFIATLQEDSNTEILIQQEGEYTDLKIPIEMWLTNGVLYLPSEH